MSDVNNRNAENPIVIEGDVLPPPSTTDKYSSRAKLQTPRQVAEEIARVYRSARSGQLNISNATKLTYILQVLSKALMDADVEERITELERKTNEKL